MQVFGGIAFTAEHPAHRFLRRIVVREQQFGDAAHHERALGRALAAGAVPSPSLTEERRDDADDRDRLQRPDRPAPGGDHAPAPSPRSSARCSPTRCTTRAGWRCDVALISGGKSNLTYRVACDAGEVVLRRPPLGHILPTAHDMAREHRVLTRARGHRRARCRACCTSAAPTSALGAPFYVMERVVGHICRNALPRRLRRHAATQRAAIGEALVDVLADLHTVDPAAVGLGGVRPARRASWSASCGAGRSSGRPRRRDDAAGARRAARRARRARCRRAARARDRARRLPARQHGPAPDGAGPHRRGARLGDEHARRPAHRPRRAARVLERGGRRPRCSPRRASSRR